MLLGFNESNFFVFEFKIQKEQTVWSPKITLNLNDLIPAGEIRLNYEFEVVSSINFSIEVIFENFLILNRFELVSKYLIDLFIVFWIYFKIIGMLERSERLEIDKLVGVMEKMEKCAKTVIKATENVKESVEIMVEATKHIKEIAKTLKEVYLLKQD